ncbi:FliM/FliN family flagellar motor switch protein [Ensifer soli]|uniref:FliM/FliN family flagellar motor switch protein n=1 Tax=Ciceribacter sp. sgz301302 TaxID=3342379 RepID=UPI0035B92F17
MARPAASPRPAFDPRLLARMTGTLGDDRAIGKICGELGHVLVAFLPDVIAGETGLTMAFEYKGFTTGAKSALIAAASDGTALCDFSLRNWCPDFTIACGSPVFIAMIETLLGALGSTPPKPRALSTIEIDLATAVFQRVADVLRSGVNAAGGFEPVGNRPYNAAERPPAEKGAPDPFAAAIHLTVTLGNVQAPISLVIPQQALLKTVVAVPKGADAARKTKSDWSVHLEEQVRRSAVTIEARIRLERLTLDTISRLQPGDVIPFLDTQDVRVEVNANGRELYVCEFGRSGAKYTVRVKDTYASDNDILNHLMQ